MTHQENEAAPAVTGEALREIRDLLVEIRDLLKNQQLSSVELDSTASFAQAVMDFSEGVALFKAIADELTARTAPPELSGSGGLE